MTTAPIPQPTPQPTDDVRIQAFEMLSPPSQVIGEAPASFMMAETVDEARQATHRILRREDDRLLVIIGPCSIHDPTAALDYAGRLAEVRRAARGRPGNPDARLFREAPHHGRVEGADQRPGPGRRLQDQRGPAPGAAAAAGLTALGLPAGCEFLDVTTPQYIADLVAWGAIGARTTESQIHREMASGLSCPVGFKNGTDGDVKIAVDAVLAASQPHRFLAVNKEARGHRRHHRQPDGHRPARRDAAQLRRRRRRRRRGLLAAPGCPSR